MAGKQAKVLGAAQVRAVTAHLASTRYPKRDVAMFLLSVRAGLRAAEIAEVQWSMVIDAAGNVADTLNLEDRVAKRGGGGTLPLSRDLRDALIALHQERQPSPEDHIINSERGHRMTAGGVVQWFRRVYGDLGFSGASSHSGRRTFITSAARKISLVGGSLRDVQELARHRSLVVTARYIQPSEDAKRRVVDAI